MPKLGPLLSWSIEPKVMSDCPHQPQKTVATTARRTISSRSGPASVCPLTSWNRLSSSHSLRVKQINNSFPPNVLFTWSPPSHSHWKLGATATCSSSCLTRSALIWQQLSDLSPHPATPHDHCPCSLPVSFLACYNSHLANFFSFNSLNSFIEM